MQNFCIIEGTYIIKENKERIRVIQQFEKGEFLKHLEVLENLNLFGIRTEALYIINLMKIISKQ